MKKNLLVTGASGFLGWNLCQEAQAIWEVYGTYYQHPLVIPGINLIKIDLRDLTLLEQLFQEIQPDAVIHTCAQSNPNFCQQHPQASYLINVIVSANLARLCNEAKIPLIFTSTDLVFDGLNAPYQETDLVCPINIYGEQKAEAERKILTIYPQATICRMPLMFGIVPPTANSFIQPFINHLKTGKELSLFTDEFRTPVSGKTAAKGLLLVLEKQVKKIINLGGKERVSRYQFGLTMAEVLNFPQYLIKPCQQKDLVMAAPRSPDVSLNSSKAFSLGYKPLSIKEELFDIAHLLS